MGVLGVSESVQSWIPAAMVLAPLITPALVYLAGPRWPRLRDQLVLITSGLVAVLAAKLLPVVRDGRVVVCQLGQVIPPFELGFRVDVLSLFVTFVSAAIWFLVALYSLAYMKGEHDQTRYYAFFLLTLAGAMGSFMAADLFTLFLFFEIMSLPAYVLIIHDQTPRAMRAGLRYLSMTISGSLAFVFGLVVTYQSAGTLSLSGTGILAPGSPLAGYGFAAFVVAFGMKAGLVPLHVWLSEAHPVAPSPASALLSGVMLKAGAYGLLRVFYNLYGVSFLRETGWADWLLAAASASILLGSAVAITQTDLKRRLAYSSIGQMGYILLGMSLLTERALVGDIFHIFAHAVVKSCLFLCAGAVIRQTGATDISQLAGIGRRMPVTMGCFALAALTIIGIPPMNGFVSEWQLSLGAFDAGKPAYAGLLLLSSLMGAAYYLPVVITAFFGTAASPADAPLVPPSRPRGRALAGEAPAAMLAPMVVLAAACVLFSLMPTNYPLLLSEMAARMLIGR